MSTNGHSRLSTMILLLALALPAAGWGQGTLTFEEHAGGAVVTGGEESRALGVSFEPPILIVDCAVHDACAPAAGHSGRMVAGPSYADDSGKRDLVIHFTRARRQVSFLVKSGRRYDPPRTMLIAVDVPRADGTAGRHNYRLSTEGDWLRITLTDAAIHQLRLRSSVRGQAEADNFFLLDDLEVEPEASDAPAK